jgi:hypothetical protein
MPTRIEMLKNGIAHAEACELTARWVAEMTARLPAMEAAATTRAVVAASAWQDTRQIRDALKLLVYFTPSEMSFGDGSFDPSKVMAKLKAELAAAEANPPPAVVWIKAKKFIKTDLPGKNGWRASED